MMEGLSMKPNNDYGPLLSLPLEIREKIYAHIFTNVFAKTYKSSTSHVLAILGACSKIHSEASSVLYNRTPLRFMIGHRQVVSSIPPPPLIFNRFQNIYFKIVKMSSTHPSYDFATPFQSITDALLRSSILRKSCSMECELDEYATINCSGYLLQTRIRSFTNFEILTVKFEGKVLESEFPPEAIADDDPRRDYKLYMRDLREEARRRECASLTEAEGMFRVLETSLGQGEMFDGTDGLEALCVRIMVFHPSQHSTRTQG